VERDEGMMKSQNNIDFLKNNTAIYRSRAERSAYLATVVNKNFINSTADAQALYEFVTGDLMPSNSLSQDAIATSRYALNCQDPDIIVDLRKLNGRPKNELFDPFWAKIVVVVEGRVDDRRHGEITFYMYCIALQFNIALILTYRISDPSSVVVASLIHVASIIVVVATHVVVDSATAIIVADADDVSVAYGVFLGDKLYLPVATSISNLIKKTVEALEVEHAPKTLEEAGI
jgi:hypothetical protein